MARTLRRGAVGVTVAGVVALFAGVVLAAPAAATPIIGGCTGTVNGVDATTVTSDRPVVVPDDAQLLVQGSVPQQFAAQNPVSNTTLEMKIVEGVAGIKGDQEPSTGATYTANDVNLDDYRQFANGLYRIEVENVGPATDTGPAWKCSYTAYLELEGGALSAPAGWVAFAAVVGSVVGVLFAKGRKPKYPGWIDEALGTGDQIAREESWQAAGLRHPDAIEFAERGQHGWRPPSALPANEEVIWSGKVRLRGKPLAGALWGVLLGLGIGVLGWQDARWTLNLGSLVVLPAVTALITGLFAWIGWGYRIRDVAVLPARPEPAPEPAQPLPQIDDTASIRPPTTAEPTTGEPTTGEPTTGEPVSAEPTIAEPTSGETTSS
jgi:hypothetical protein